MKKANPLLDYWPHIVAVLLSLLGSGTMWVVNDHLKDDAYRDQQIRELQGIILSEWPQYTKTIYWEKN